MILLTTRPWKAGPLLKNRIRKTGRLEYRTSDPYMSRDMTKPSKWLCAQRRLRSAWASAQSDQSLRCTHEESLGPLATH